MGDSYFSAKWSLKIAALDSKPHNFSKPSNSETICLRKRVRVAKSETSKEAG